MWIKVETAGEIETLALTGEVVRAAPLARHGMIDYAIKLSDKPSPQMNRWRETLAEELLGRDG